MITKDNLLKLGVTRICGYSRKSRSDGNPEETLSKHNQILNDFLSNINIPYDIKAEIGSSESIEERIVFKELMDDIEDGKYNAICYVEQSRLARDGAIIKQMFKFFRRNNIVLIDLKNQRIVNLDEEELDDMTFFESVTDELYIRQAKRVLNRGRRLSAKNGNAMVSRMYGLKRNPKTKLMDIVEDEAEAIRIMFNMAKDGYSVGKIAVHINSLGYKTLKGNPFSAKAIWDILKKSAYCGDAVWRKKSYDKVDGKWDVRNNSDDKVILVEDAWTPIVSKEVFDEVQKQLSAKVINDNKTKKSTKFWCSELFVCGVCGRKLTIYKNKYGRLVVRACDNMNYVTNKRKCCNSGGQIDEVEDLLLDRVIAYRDDIAKEMSNEKYQKENISAIEKKIKRIQSEIDKIDIKINKTMDLLESGVYDIETFKLRNLAHKEEKLKLENDIGVLEKSLNKDTKFDLQSTLEQLDIIIKNIPITTSGEKRNLLWKTQIDRIEWIRKNKTRDVDIKIYFKTKENTMDKKRDFMFCYQCQIIKSHFIIQHINKIYLH